MIKENYEIKVTPEQSKKIQEICFKHDVAWRTGVKRVMFVDENPFTKTYLLINPTTKGITYLSNKDNYYISTNQIIDADEFIRMYSDTESYPERINKNIKTFELIRSNSEKYQGRIEVDYKPITGYSNSIVYTALVRILPNTNKPQKLNLSEN